MTSLLNANLPSDDEEDTDYDPTKDKTGSGDERKAPGAAASSRRGRIALTVDIPNVTAGEKRAREADVTADTKGRAVDEAKKAKVNDIWAKLKQKTSAGLSSTPIISQPGVSKPAPIGTPAHVEQQRVGPGDGLAQRGGQTAPAAEQQKLGVLLTSIAAAALAAARMGTSVSAAQQHGKVAVQEVRNFAGKEIKVTTTLSASAAAAAASKKKEGLDAVLASLQAAKKINILDKSRNDWQGYKKANAEVEDGLEAHQKGGAKYLDKVDFLKRAELREYEQERDKRLASNVNTRGRL